MPRAGECFWCHSGRRFRTTAPESVPSPLRSTRGVWHGLRPDIEEKYDQVAFWEGVRAGEIHFSKTAGYKWSTVAKGDQVKLYGSWCEVVRVKSKAVSVSADYSWTDTVPYAEFQALTPASIISSGQLDRVQSPPGAPCPPGKCPLSCELPVVRVVPGCCPGSFAIGFEGRPDSRQDKGCGYQSEDAHAHGHTEPPAQGIDNRFRENRDSHAVWSDCQEQGEDRKAHCLDRGKKGSFLVLALEA